MNNEKPSKVILRSKEGTEFEIDKSVAMQSETIKDLIERGRDTNIVQLDLTGRILSRVVKYWSLQVKPDATRAEVSLKVRPWRAEFEDDVEEVMEIVMAANYLSCRELSGVVRKIVQEITPRDAAAYFELRGFEGSGSESCPPGSS